MKIIDWAIIFVLLTAPLYWISMMRADDRMEVLRLEQRYNAALKSAVLDGASRLNMNEHPQFEAGYTSDKFFMVNRDAGLQALLETLYLNFGVVDDPIGQEALMNFVPAVVVLEYDGYSIYGLHDFRLSDGTEEVSRGWFPKKPYTWTDASGNIISFSLDKQLTLLDKSKSVFLQGFVKDLKTRSSDPLLTDEEQLDAVRRTAIVSSVQSDLENIISSHNRYAEQAGVQYTFTLPTISDETWNNTLDDTGMLVFLQGIPLGDLYYNNFAFSGGRLLKKSVVYGGVDERSGIRYYFKSSACRNLYRKEETFANEREAAAKGYFEARCSGGTVRSD